MSAPNPGLVDPRKVREANVMLAVATGLALAMLAVAASLTSPAGPVRDPGMAIGVTLLYVIVYEFLLKRRAQPLIQPDAPITLLFGAILPLIIVACAAWALLWPGHDFGLAIIVGAALFGMTLRSAWAKA